MISTWPNVIVNGLVAVGTISLAVIAVRNIRMTRKMAIEDRDYRLLEKSPVFGIVSYTPETDANSGLLEWVTLEVENVGFGPALSVSVECSQGSSRLRLSLEEGVPPVHLGIKERATWIFQRDTNLTEDRDSVKELIITITCKSMFERVTQQTFVCSPDKTSGRIEEDQQPVLRDINL